MDVHLISMHYFFPQGAQIHNFLKNEQQTVQFVLKQTLLHIDRAVNDFKTQFPSVQKKKPKHNTTYLSYVSIKEVGKPLVPGAALSHLHIVNSTFSNLVRMSAVTQQLNNFHEATWLASRSVIRSLTPGLCYPASHGWFQEVFVEWTDEMERGREERMGDLAEEHLKIASVFPSFSDSGLSTSFLIMM